MKTGLYEQLISNELHDLLEEMSEAGVRSESAPLDSAESSQRLTEYLAGVLRSRLDAIADKEDHLPRQVELVNRVIDLIGEAGDPHNAPRAACETIVPPQQIDAPNAVHEPAQQLLAIERERNSVAAINCRLTAVRPETSISQSSLFTGAVREPQMFSELKREIASCDRIDMLVSFIKWSGLRLLLDDLTRFVESGGALRVITTSYMGATDYKAIERLSELPNTQIKVSYDTKMTRLHAKSYTFYRGTGFSTAYVGSSNISNPALTEGLEWNVKVTQCDQPEVMQKIAATFETYWNSAEFEAYRTEDAERLRRALMQERGGGRAGDQPAFNFDLRPFSYQQEILDRLTAEREIRGHYKNLVVAATGTGKTMIAAFDFKRFVQEYRSKNDNHMPRMMFVVHREEILRQSQSAFRHVLRDANFGDLFVGGAKPERLDHLFVSVQTYNSQRLWEAIDATYYDYIVVDEFHHAAADAYRCLLHHHTPVILLGLTATPERMDGRSIMPYFDNRIAADMRLPEAIERKLLAPFQYFGVSDETDLSQIQWVRGGYDRASLSKLFTFEDIARRRAQHILDSLDRYVNDIAEVKGLGFCVSVEHAEYMASFFNEQGVPCIALSSNTCADERANAKRRLVGGEIRFIFVVDLYNEGVDIPEIDTVLFLRPTESLTVFLQQLGRGLRLCEGKECLTVLDYIGRANTKYRFEERFGALTTRSDRSIEGEIKNGFHSLPKGCYIQLERVARDHILHNIRQSLTVRSGIISRLASFAEDSGMALTLTNFLDYYHLDPRILYARGSFARLMVEAGVAEPFDQHDEKALTRALRLICFTDSPRMIRIAMRMLQDDAWDYSAMDRRLLRMWINTIWQRVASDDELKDEVARIRRNPVIADEMVELLSYQLDRIDVVSKPLSFAFEMPLDLHCSYSRNQILLAMDMMKPDTVREGAKYLADRGVDLLFVTLNKSNKDYSPTTLYDDYSINETLFHWQSQSTISDGSPTGKRYVSPPEGHSILLFVRENRRDKILNETEWYTFIGKVQCVDSVGACPMNITWRLEEAIPAKYFKKTNKLLVV